jgi:hypothetical protein
MRPAARFIAPDLARLPIVDFSRVHLPPSNFCCGTKRRNPITRQVVIQTDRQNMHSIGGWGTGSGFAASPRKMIWRHDVTAR